MSRLPRKSPWGDIQNCEVLYKGVFMVRVSSPEGNKGGIMVRLADADFLSEAAIKCGVRSIGYITFEKGNAESVVIRELLDKKLWEIPEYIGDRTKYEEKLNLSLQQSQPGYWKTRAKALPLSQRLKEGAEKAADYNAASVHAAVKCDSIQIGL